MLRLDLNVNTPHQRVTDRASLPPRNIMVPTDFGPAAAAALDHGRSLARAYSATLHIVHAMKDVATLPVMDAPAIEYGRVHASLERHAREQLDALAASEDADVTVTTALVSGPSPALAILDYARRMSIDVILIGTHGRNALSDFILGSVAQKVIRSASCPVMTIRAHPASDAAANVVL